MPNYYDILGVQPSASEEAIKGAFRRLVKTYHPDRNRDRRQWAESKFKTIHEAYQTLSDKDRRVAYDRIMFGGPPPDDPSYAKFYEKLQSDVGYRARRVLSDLLNGRGAEAVANYEQLCEEIEDFSLLHYMSIKDYLDAKFLLGEQYETQGDVKKALEFYLEVYSEESEGPRLRYFFDEVCDRIIGIYCRDLARNAPPKQAIRYYQKAARIHMSEAQRSQIYKKIAEKYLQLDDIPRARAALEKAFKINPKMKGAQRLCEKLGVQASKAAAAQ